MNHSIFIFFFDEFNNIVDENVLIGSVPASADKISVTDYGSLEDVGNKLATKRQNAKIVSSEARKTDGNIFYSYAFEYPIDNSIPRTGSKSNRPTKVVELYELCVAKGKLWSVKATSTDKLFPKHEELFRNTLASFTPRL